MANPPDSNQIYNQGQALSTNPQTPGLNGVVAAWRTLEDFCGNWAVGTYNQLEYVASLIGGTI